MGELDEKFVDSPAFLEEGNGAIRLNYAQEDCSWRAGGTRAERGRRTRGAIAEPKHAGLTNFLFQTAEGFAQIRRRRRIREIPEVVIADPDAKPFRIEHNWAADEEIAASIGLCQVSGYDFVEVGCERLGLRRVELNAVELDMEGGGFSHGVVGVVEVELGVPRGLGCRGERSAPSVKARRF